MCRSGSSLGAAGRGARRHRLAYIMYMFNPGPAVAPWLAMFRPIYLFLLNKWYFDELYDASSCGLPGSGAGLWKRGDGAVIDGVGPDGIAAATHRCARRASRLQSGYVYHYAFAMLIGVVVLVTWYMSSGARADRDVPNSSAFPDHLPAAVRRHPDPPDRAARGGLRGAQRALRGAVDLASTFIVSRCCSGSTSTRHGGVPVVEKARLDPRAEHQLQDGRGRHLHVLRAAVDPADADLHPGQLGGDQGPGQGVHDRLSGAGDHDGRHVLRARLVVFYVFFEGVLIPMFLIIGIWGGRAGSMRPSSSSSTRWPARC